jgi:hypothetical protein
MNCLKVRTQVSTEQSADSHLGANSLWPIQRLRGWIDQAHEAEARHVTARVGIPSSARVIPNLHP